MSGPGEPGEGPAAESTRAARIEQRVEELRRRRAQLAAGERPSPESVQLARQRAEDSLHRAVEAHTAAARWHEESARVHERAANSYQRAALAGDDGPPDELQEKADRHWQAAHDSHLQAVEDQAQARDARRSSSD